MKENEIVNQAIEKLFSKMQSITIQDLNISEYNKNYLKKYKDNYSFYMSLYSQLLLKTLGKLTKPISESTFVDYGGGCGMLSYLAKELGFKTVVYNDLFETSVKDVQIISKSLDEAIDYYICGDVEEFIDEINLLRIKPDLICSFDVLEHIYDLDLWIRAIAKIDSEFSLLFMTSANSSNPIINYRLKKLHRKTEFEGFEVDSWSKENDLNSAFFQERIKIIQSKFPDLKYEDIELLSAKTRGLRKDDIEKVVYDYIQTGKIYYAIEHPTNTCDPYTGNWAEKIINLKKLKILIKSINLDVDISNTFYGYSNNTLLNIPKRILNYFIKILGTRKLFLSPSYVLEIQKRPSVNKGN